MFGKCANCNKQIFLKEIFRKDEFCPYCNALLNKKKLNAIHAIIIPLAFLIKFLYLDDLQIKCVSENMFYIIYFSSIAAICLLLRWMFGYNLK
jgi:DNA-directed RNA polymerase subunit RPC12/RpoP